MSERDTVTEAVEAGAKAAFEMHERDLCSDPSKRRVWEDTNDALKEVYRYSARGTIEAVLPIIVAGERRKAFDSLMDAYECWVTSGAATAGKEAIGNTVFFLYPEFRDEARERATALRAPADPEDSNER